MVYSHEMQFSHEILFSILNILMAKDLDNFKMHLVNLALYRSKGFDKIKNPLIHKVDV